MQKFVVCLHAPGRCGAAQSVVAKWSAIRAFGFAACVSKSSKFKRLLWASEGGKSQKIKWMRKQHLGSE